MADEVAVLEVPGTEALADPFAEDTDRDEATETGVLGLLEDEVWKSQELLVAEMEAAGVPGSETLRAAQRLRMAGLVERARWAGGFSWRRKARLAEQESARLEAAISQAPLTEAEKRRQRILQAVADFRSRRSRAEEESDGWDWREDDTKVYTHGLDEPPYTFDKDGLCNCPDRIHRDVTCKHMLARDSRRQRREMDFGN